MMSATGDAKKAFTLLELLIVMALMVILAGMAVPHFKRTAEEMKFRGVAEKFHSVLDRLHERAMWERKMITLDIDTQKNGYRYYLGDDENNARSAHFPNDIKIDADKDLVLFYPDGSIDVANISLTGDVKLTALFLTQGVFGGIKMQIK